MSFIYVKRRTAKHITRNSIFNNLSTTFSEQTTIIRMGRSSSCAHLHLIKNNKQIERTAQKTFLHSVRAARQEDGADTA